jgi:imidazolonepropionase-like amidohydrolase
MDFESIAAKNNEARSFNSPASAKIAIDNVRVFNGHDIGPATTVVIDGTIIGEDTTGAKHIDAKGSTLIPGLIDSHCHPSNITHLQDLSRFGVTTGFTMACFEPQMCKSLKGHTGLADILTTTAPASAPGSAHGIITAMIDPSLLIHNDSQVPAWVERQLAAGPDYVKLIAETPGLSQKALTDLVNLVHQGGKMVSTHASTYQAYEQAIMAGTDHIQHVPMDKSVSRDMVIGMLRHGQTITPTLTMMRNSAKNNPVKYSFKPAIESVTSIHKAGIPILAGTDSNTAPGVPAMVPFGSSMHDELENLVEAGMSNLEALRSATYLPAFFYGLRDRGAIVPGMRADLILIDGNPLEDIKATRRIQKVWLAGVEHSGSQDA